MYEKQNLTAAPGWNARCVYLPLSTLTVTSILFVLLNTARYYLQANTAVIFCVVYTISMIRRYLFQSNTAFFLYKSHTRNYTRTHTQTESHTYIDVHKLVRKQRMSSAHVA